MRLDTVAEAGTGVRIWISEFDLREPNVTKRALDIKDILTMFYSHPAVHGIILWGFWDGANRVGELDASLVDGDDFVVMQSF